MTIGTPVLASPGLVEEAISDMAADFLAAVTSKNADFKFYKNTIHLEPSFLSFFFLFNVLEVLGIEKLVCAVT